MALCLLSLLTACQDKPGDEAKKRPAGDEPSKGELIVVVSDARDKPSDLADALARKLDTETKSKDGYIEIAGGGVHVLIAETVEAAERDLTSAKITPKGIVVYFSGVQSMGMPVKNALNGIAQKKLSVLACVQTDDLIDDKELIELQSTECRDSVEEAGFSIGSLESIVITLSSERNLDDLVTLLRRAK